MWLHSGVPCLVVPTQMLGAPPLLPYLIQSLDISLPSRPSPPTTSAVWDLKHRRPANGGRTTWVAVVPVVGATSNVTK